jgi:hypothetical protein
LLYYDISKHCTCPLNKFIYSFKIVKLFLKNLIFKFTELYALYEAIGEPSTYTSAPHKEYWRWDGRRRRYESGKGKKERKGANNYFSIKD